MAAWMEVLAGPKTIMEFTREVRETNYSRLDTYMKEKGYSEAASRNINLVFAISQSEEAASAYEALLVRELPIVESFHDLAASIELVKLGFYKHAFASLRMGLDNGLLSAYWNAVGYDRPEFKRWLSSREKTPRKDSQFWRSIRQLPGVECFFERFSYEKVINCLSERLNDYVHIRGFRHSTFGESQRRIRAKNVHIECDEWYDLFVNTTRIIVTLQLLAKPKLTVVAPYEFLLRKFGYYDHVPLCGVLLGDQSDLLKSRIGESEYDAISTMARKTNEVKDVWNYLTGCPDLPDEEIRKLNREFWKSTGLDDDTVKTRVDETLHSIREFETQSVARGGCLP